MPLTFGFAATGYASEFSVTQLTHSESGVNFTLSPQATGTSQQWAMNQLVDGEIEITNTSYANGFFTMTFNDGGGNSVMSGNIVLDIFGTGGFTWLTSNGTGIMGTAAGVDNVAFAATGGTFVTGIRFSVSTNDTLEINSLTTTANSLVCFLEGTGIDTAEGSCPVEDLQAGDRIRTADGGLTTVKWVGRQTVNPRTDHPAKINPVCIKAGALADGVPFRDLYVSGDHAMELNGVLYNAGALVNGTSIYRVGKMPLEPFSYYHVETERHELILAEGASSESYLDIPSRESFDNAAEAPDQRIIEEMRLLRVSAVRLVPETLRAYLAERAERIAIRAA